MSGTFERNSADAREAGTAHGEQHFTPHRSAAPHAEASRWAEAFQKNVLARHDATNTAATSTPPVAEPQPSRRPTPHSATTIKTTTTTASSGTGPYASHGGSRSQSQSALASPTPRAPQPTAAATFSEGSDGCVIGGAATVPRVMTSRTVAAVAVHPPLSRNSKRATMTPAAAAAAAAAATTSTVSSTARSASLPSSTSVNSASQSAAAEGGTEAGSNAPPPHASLSCEAGAACGASSVTATPKRAAPVQVYTTPHARLQRGISNSGVKAKPLSQLQLQTQQVAGGAAAAVAGGSGNSPMNSTATPRIPGAYATSPFFQRVTEHTNHHASAALPARASPSAEDRTPHVSDGAAEQDDSALLEEVTPISHGGGSWRHDSQLLSQPREAMKTAAIAAAAAAAAAASGVATAASDSGDDYFRTLERSLHGRNGAADSAAAVTNPRLPFGSVSQLHPPPPPPSSMAAALPSNSAATAAAAVMSGTSGSVWDANGHSPSAYAGQTSPYQQSLLYYPPGYAPESGAVAGKPPCMGFPSPPFTPADVTRLSASPGGLSGSHNAIHNSNTTFAASGMMSGLMMPSQLMDSTPAAHHAPPHLSSFQHQQQLPPPPPLPQQPQQSPLSLPGLYHGAGGVSPYFHCHHGSNIEGTHAMCGGVDVHAGASPTDFRPTPTHHHTLSQSSSPSPYYSAVASRGAAGYGGTLPTNGPVPTVSGTTAAVASGLSGVALEKQLLHASKEELVQILLELGSCNPEASRFIDAKAFFFAFRHEHTRVVPTPPLPAARAKDERSGSCRSTDAKEDKTSRGETEVATTTAVPLTTRRPGESTSSSNHSIARCIFPAEAAAAAECDDDEAMDDEANNHAVPEHQPAAAPTSTTLANKSAPTPPPSATTAVGAGPHLPERRVRPEERAFSADVHPCLRWYGACRNATSCAYAGLPRNLCLNWVRGACVARTECSGVHRLPDPCPPELQRIYLLNHGLAREDAGQTLHAIAASAAESAGAAKSELKNHTVPTSPPQLCNGTTHAPLTAAGAAKATTMEAGDARVPICTEAKDGVTTVCKRSEGGDGDTGAPHTPRNQSIHKDTYVDGGDSTPHRHHPPHQAGLRQRASRQSSNALSHGKGNADGAATKAPLSPWSAMDVDVDTEVAMAGAMRGEEPCHVDAYLHDLRLSCVDSPTGSSCSTVEDRTMSDTVSRCLRHDFDCAWSPTSDTAAAAAVADDDNDSDAATKMTECGGRRSPVVLPVREMLKAPALPLRSVATEVGQRAEDEDEEEDDLIEAAAPAAGTRTRMQSPSYV